MPEKCVMDPSQNCLGLAEAKLLEKRIEDLEEWRLRSSKFHEDFYGWQKEQIARDSRMDEQLKNMNTNIDKLVLWQEKQNEKPARRWEAIVEKVLLAVIGAIVVYIMTQIGF